MGNARWSIHILISVMKLKLRPYQEEAVAKAAAFFREENPDPALIVLPTGWGKSILTAFVAASIPQYERLLVVQPTKELLEQNHAKYMALCGEMAQAGIFSASFGKKEIGRITYATIGSIKELGKTFREHGFTKMLIDEAHLYPREAGSMLGRFLADSGITHVLGITATPLKPEQYEVKAGEKFDRWTELIMLTGLAPSGNFFRNILHVGQVQEMIRLGSWSPLTYDVLPFDRSALVMNSTGAEYTDKSIIATYMANNTRANILSALEWYKDRKHVLVFVPGVEEAMELASAVPESACVWGTMPKKERKAAIDGFREGRIRVIINVAVLQTGFDYPKIDMIILGRSTASVALYYQILGRGVRVDPEKKDCKVIDMGGNVERFGRVEDIVFKKGPDRWRMYGTDGVLLSGLPVDVLGTVDRTDVNRTYTSTSLPGCVSFGRHRGTAFEDIPMSYLRWLLKENPPYMGEDERCAVIRAVENHVRDTRSEPPAMIMPDGNHAGMRMEFVPKGYLFWYYRSKQWDETNDSLRRGLELTLGYVPHSS